MFARRNRIIIFIFYISLILYTTMSEKSMNEDNGKLIREIQTNIEELQKYKTDVIDKFKEKFSEKINLILIRIINI